METPKISPGNSNVIYKVKDMEDGSAGAELLLKL